MNKRMLWGPLAALGALYAISIGFRMADDMRRYNRILAMSDEEPISQKMPGIAMQIVSEERETFREWLRLLLTFPSDLLRYFRMESM